MTRTKAAPAPNYTQKAITLCRAGRTHETFDGTFANGDKFSARADLFVIRAAWDAGVSFESEADGFGSGLGTCGGDWSGIRDSSESATREMLKKALRHFIVVGA